MSVLVKDEQGEYYLFSKGADEILYQLLTNKDKNDYSYTEKEINKQTGQGYRSLLLTYKKIDIEKGASFEKQIKQLKNDVRARREYEKLIEEIEKDLSVIGAVFMEDKL